MEQPATPPTGTAPGPPVAEFEFTLTAGEIGAFYRLARRQLRTRRMLMLGWRRVLAVLAAILAAGLIGYLLPPDGLSRIEAGRLAFIGGLTAMAVAGILLSAVRATAGRAPGDTSLALRKAALYAEGIGTESMFTRSFFPWSAISGIRLYDRLLVFWVGSQNGIPIPASAAGGPQELRRAYATAHELWTASRGSAATASGAPA